MTLFTRRMGDYGLLKKVQILMSTFNGEEYIRDQIESILNQDYTNIELLIRDDGSTDSTVAIIKEYVENYSNVKYFIGENRGACDSFFELIKLADKDSDYYAFSDQDDFWLPNKISRAVCNLEKENEEEILLYTCGYTVVDDDLHSLHTKKKIKNIKPSFRNAFIENVCIGCAMVFNNRFYHELYNKLPQGVYMHDWWLYLVSTCIGKLIYDNGSYLLYRQHNNNAIGIQNSVIKRWSTRYHNYRKMKIFRERQLSQLLSLYKLDDEKKYIIKELIQTKTSVKSRIKLIFRKEIYRQKKLDDYIFKFLILINGY